MWKPRPKSDAGERVTSLDPTTVDAPRAYLAAQAEQRLQLGPAWQRRQADRLGQHRDDVVFTWPDGSMIPPALDRLWFLAASAAAGLPRIRLHDLRHTYASTGLANATGWHEAKIISQRAGARQRRVHDRHLRPRAARGGCRDRRLHAGSSHPGRGRMSAVGTIRAALPRRLPPPGLRVRASGLLSAVILRPRASGGTVDTLGLGPSALGCAGSTPASRTAVVARLGLLGC